MFMKVNIQFKPRFSGPIKKPLAPSKFITQVADALIPILCSIEPQVTWLGSARLPSALTFTLGTINSEMPLVPAGAPGRRARTIWIMLSVISCSPAEMKIF